jgi:hypothetical protein
MAVVSKGKKKKRKHQKRKAKRRAQIAARRGEEEERRRGVITHGVVRLPPLTLYLLLPSPAQRGKRYSLITDDKWSVSAVMRRPG